MIVLAIGLGACSRPGGTFVPPAPLATTAKPAPNATGAPGSTSAPEQPTATAEAPAAARVNGEPILVTQLQAELARFQQAAGHAPTAEERQRVLDDLIDQTLLAQAAKEKGYSVTDAVLQERITQLTGRMGGNSALTNWMKTNGYNVGTFRQDLARSIAAAWMRDQISAQVPSAVEQVHLRQILVFDQDTANQMLAALQAGKNFATLAAQNDPVTEGDLGWVARGVLPNPALEQAAFSLEAGKYSPIIADSSGFHLLQVIAKDAQRPLDAQTRLGLQAQAIRSWLETRRSQSQIQILQP